MRMSTALGFGIFAVVTAGAVVWWTVPMCACTSPEKSATMAMKSQLRNLAMAEESHYADYNTYTASLPDSLLSSDSLVTVTIDSASKTAWRASASHARVDITCRISIGEEADPADPNARPWEPQCSQ